MLLSDRLNVVDAEKDLLLAQLALRIEVADAAAFAAGRRVDDGVDQRGLA
jgi:hypothetical protein